MKRARPARDCDDKSTRAGQLAFGFKEQPVRAHPAKLTLYSTTVDSRYANSGQTGPGRTIYFAHATIEHQCDSGIIVGGDIPAGSGSDDRERSASVRS